MSASGQQQKSTKAGRKLSRALSLRQRSLFGAFRRLFREPIGHPGGGSRCIWRFAAGGLVPPDR
eukprot:4687742-Alexandrium_andersonii.AAC.1